MHIRREGAIPIDEWKQAASSVPGVRLDDAPMTVTNPKTGTTVTVPGSDGDAAVLLRGKWVKVFHYFEGGISFKSGPVAIDDPNASSACRRSAAMSLPGMPFSTRQSGRQLAGALGGKLISVNG